MLRYPKRLMRFEELWYDETGSPEPADVRVICQAPERPIGVASRAKYTILIDLAAPEDVIFDAIKKDARNEIRRAQKDRVSCVTLDPGLAANRLQFYDFADDFAAKRDLSRLDRARLEIMAAQGQLALTEARDAEGRRCVTHAYFCQAGRARLLLSISELPVVSDGARRNVIGRANRLLHWYDISAFRAKGLRFYDFGGWYVGDSDQAKLGINRFKREFGGVIVKEYNAIYGLNWRGKLAVMFWRFFDS